MNISDEAVEAARSRISEDDWLSRATVQAMLEAAAPHLIAAAWDEAFKKGADWVDAAGEHPDEQADWTNPYRAAGAWE